MNGINIPERNQTMKIKDVFDWSLSKQQYTCIWIWICILNFSSNIWLFSEKNQCVWGKNHKLSYDFMTITKNELVFSLFVWGFPPSSRMFTHVETITGEGLQILAPMAVEHWRFFSVQIYCETGHCEIYTGHHRGPVTLTPVA